MADGILHLRLTVIWYCKNVVLQEKSKKLPRNVTGFLSNLHNKEAFFFSMTHVDFAKN